MKAQHFFCDSDLGKSNVDLVLNNNKLGKRSLDMINDLYFLKAIGLGIFFKNLANDN